MPSEMVPVQIFHVQIHWMLMYQPKLSISVPSFGARQGLSIFILKCSYWYSGWPPKKQQTTSIIRYQGVKHQVLLDGIFKKKNDTKIVRFGEWPHFYARATSCSEALCFHHVRPCSRPYVRKLFVSTHFKDNALSFVWWIGGSLRKWAWCYIQDGRHGAKRKNT